MHNWGTVGIQASAEGAKSGGGVEPREGRIHINILLGPEIRQATEPAERGGGLTDKGVPACDGVDDSGMVGRALSDLPGIVEVVGIAARRERVAGVLGKAPSAAWPGGGLRRDHGGCEEQDPSRPDGAAERERRQIMRQWSSSPEQCTEARPDLPARTSH